MAGCWQTEKRAVLDASREIAAKGLVVGAAGNVSVRLGGEGDELLAITPSRKSYLEMAVDDIQIIDFDADSIEGDQVPSVESMMHIGAYRRRPDVRAVVHTHSVYASVLAVAGLELPPIIDEMVMSIGGEVAVTEYAFPSSEELAENVSEALCERNAVLLANHGVVGVGADLREAITVCELVERAAHVYVLARAIGQVRLLPDDVVATEKELFKMMHLAESC